MLENEVVVIIPTYKEFDQLTSDEILSFHQCYKVLKNYQICIVHSFELNIELYKQYLEVHFKKNIYNKSFNNSFFSSISGYNNFMLSTNFYQSFVDFKYLLIYQLDCWVFSDQLKMWCDMGYDYIGAPIFKNFGTYKLGNEIDVIGNGGFSLRKIRKFLDVLTWKGNVVGFKYFRKLFNQHKNIRSILKMLLGLLGYHNTVPYLLRWYKKDSINEDVFFSYNFQSDAIIQIQVPDIATAIKFSFDRSPQYLYEFNQKQLPFGCHGWNRQDKIYSKSDKLFWGKFINS